MYGDVGNSNRDAFEEGKPWSMSVRVRMPEAKVTNTEVLEVFLSFDGHGKRFAVDLPVEENSPDFRVSLHGPSNPRARVVPLVNPDGAFGTLA